MREKEGFTLIELLIVVVILGILALITAPTLLNAANKAKEGAVKANLSAAASTVTTRLTVEKEDADDAANAAVNNLNTAGTPDNKDDDTVSPFDTTAKAFIAAKDPEAAGQVTLEGNDGEYSVTITGYGKNLEALDGAKETISAPTSVEDVDADVDDAF